MKHFKRFVFIHFHYLPLAGTFVVDAAEVEYSVDDHSVELITVGRPDGFGVGSDGVK